jgi:hypothetical protein
MPEEFRPIFSDWTEGLVDFVELVMGAPGG